LEYFSIFIVDGDVGI